MQICGHYITQSDIGKIRLAVESKPSISRLELSRQVCQWLDWRMPNGKLQDMSCRKVLNKLHQQGVITLPPIQHQDYSFRHRKETKLELQTPPLNGTLANLGEIKVELVTSRYARLSKVWSSLMETHHYLGIGSPCGAQIRYVINSPEHGYLGALSFSSGSWALRKRDEYIGWSESAQRANLCRLIKNDRLLILPQVEVKNLASHVLSLVLSRLPEDWEARYAVRPVLVETFVDPSVYQGTCYKAANWDYVGETAGRRNGQAKKIFVIPCDQDWRRILCHEPAVGLGEVPRPEAPANWAEAEFGTVRWYDRRLKERLYKLADDFYNKPMASIPEACGRPEQTMGAYRFFQNKKVSMDVILTPHLEATIERIKEHRIVLAPQDTTTLSYNTRSMTEGLGPINTMKDTSVGLLLHETLAFTDEGTPLGILDAQCWARDPNEKGKKYKRGQRPIEDKESMKWLRSFEKVAQVQKICPTTMLVNMGDRESDIYELFQMATADPAGPKLLVRLDRTRWRQVQDGELRDSEAAEEAGEFELLWGFMAAKPVAGTMDLHIPHSGSRRARDTTIELRFAHVQVKPPNRLSSSPAIPAWIVSVQEMPDKAVGKPLEWMLLTTVPVSSFDESVRTMEWYSGRWGIEVFHRTLKSGCRIKDRQLGTADRLESCLGIDMVVAWRIFHLTMLGRETPNVPCTVFFKDVEWKALHCYVNQTKHTPEKPPLLSEAIRMVGRMGGHMGRKSDGPPGTQVLWKGIQRLDTATEMFIILTQDDDPHPMQSGP